MFTNTYLPHVGGVARSVSCFKRDLRKMGHRVLIMAPVYTDAGEQKTDDKESDVVRLPAIQNFSGSDFSVRIPLPLIVSEKMNAFAPDIIHSHHPFLLGDTAMRMARKCNLPLVFTHHTLYERYTHYTPVDSPAMKRFVIELATRYANHCDHVIAPSESIRHLIRDRGVDAPVTVIPTGVDPDFFAAGGGELFRQRHGIATNTFVLGHIGRLAPEKNLEYLAGAAAIFLKKHRGSVFVVAGEGPSNDAIRRICEHEGVQKQLIMTGALTGSHLADAYDAFDLFVFASKTETQGMVLTEAMAAGVPVIALDASGAREVVIDKKNGRLLDGNTSAEQFAQILSEVYRDTGTLEEWNSGVKETAAHFSRAKSAKTLEHLYQITLQAFPGRNMSRDKEIMGWDNLLKALEIEWGLLVEKARAVITVGTSDSKNIGADEADPEGQGPPC
ncbi:glycosyltransferase [Desulfatitalea alkaliphila]|uniref:Glycosyltransferase n=1 Tax=Desulfatitalea alkaliphila TaxID=2929485 RepID=A0AA41QYS2_9BACT|nr:glycosyltransferase [Desulfatitalea alkaliphila]MCJ8498993.1 glycosyltransferase [Desulfatitalea alkaliphila]